VRSHEPAGTRRTIDRQGIEHIAKRRIRNGIIARGERDTRQRGAEMIVRVVEARYHDTSAYIDALRVRVGESEDLLSSANADDAISPDRQALRPRSARVGREDATVHEDDVGGCSRAALSVRSTRPLARGTENDGAGSNAARDVAPFPRSEHQQRRGGVSEHAAQDIEVAEN